MSDTPLFDHDDRVDDVEALLRELSADDFDIVPPPDDVWAGIETEISDDATVVSLAARRSTFRTRFLAAAAAVAVLAAGAVVVASLRGDDAPVIATATLEYDETTFDPLGAEATATAELIERDGRYSIRIDEATLPTDLGEPADLELWMIAVTDDGSLDVQPVSLVDAESPGTYDVPAGLDPDVYSIVDISVEPRDGDASHSSRSILRGTLDV